ncbi:disks large homolog 5-like [Alexandromys fortis]|uniref:disks large homolog 5-like n=1 Tax=Alexandromys fortis TaxID=100897 RepID=UPI0021524C21|nr:disks large homolog 5-like [Microtus fortis]
MLSRLRSLFGRESGRHPKTRERQKEAAVQCQRKTRTSKWLWRRQNTAAEPSSHPVLPTKTPVKEKMEKLTTELQLMTSQRNELRERIVFITEGTMQNRPYHKPNPFYEKLKSEHNEVMLQLKRLEEENTMASQKFSELTEETVFYLGLQSRLLMQETQLEKMVAMLRQEKRKLLEDWDLLRPHLEDWKVICKDKEEDTSDLKSQQQQDLKRLEERLQFLLKQKEVFTPEKDVEEKLQHHFEDSQMRLTSLQTDLEQAPAQDESHLQTELLEQEPPAEPHPQQLLHSGDAGASSSFGSHLE